MHYTSAHHFSPAPPCCCCRPSTVVDLDLLIYVHSLGLESSLTLRIRNSFTFLCDIKLTAVNENFMHDKEMCFVTYYTNFNNVSFITSQLQCTNTQLSASARAHTAALHRHARTTTGSCPRTTQAFTITSRRRTLVLSSIYNAIKRNSQLLCLL